MSDTQKMEARKKADGIPVFRDTGDFLLNDFSAEELGGLIREGEKTAFEDRGMKLMYYILCRDAVYKYAKFDEFYGIAEPRRFEDIRGGEDEQEIPDPPKEKPLCDTCKHAIDGVADDFAAVFCGARQGYFGQVYECDRYKDKRGDGEADSAQKPPQDPPLCASCANSDCQKCGEAMGSEKCLDYQFRGAVE